MIHETAKHLDPGWGELLDVDVLRSGYWAGIFRASAQLFVRDSSHCIPISFPIESPLIRCLEPGKVVFVDPESKMGCVNAWVLSVETNTTREFFAGNQIANVLASKDTIAVMYYDVGILIDGGGALCDEGLAIFDSSGKLRAGYHSALGPAAVIIGECYVACWESDSHIVFSPNHGADFVRLNVLTLEQQVPATHSRLRGFAGIAVSQYGMLFYKRPYILAWAPGREQPSLVGHYYEHLRGLLGGRFLAHGTNSFKIIEAVPPIPIFEKVSGGDHEGLLQILLYEDQSWEGAQEYAQQLISRHGMKLIRKFDGPDAWIWYIEYKGSTLIIQYDDFPAETIIFADKKEDEEGLKTLGTALAFGGNEEQRD